MTSQQNPVFVRVWDSVNKVAMVVNPDGSINVSGSITASNPSVGAQGAADPGFGTVGAYIDGSGNVQEVSAAHPFPIAGTFSSSFTEPTLNVTASGTTAAVLTGTNNPLTSTVGYRTAAVQVTAITSGSTLVFEQSNDGTTWYGVQIPGDTVAQSATPMTALGVYAFPVSCLQARVRCSVLGSAGTQSVNIEYRQDAIDYALESVVIGGTVSLPTGAATAAKQPALGTAGSASADILTVQGIASMTPLAVTAAQATAANLLASVGGLAANNASLSGNPVTMAGVATATEATAATTGQNAIPAMDLAHRLITLPYAAKEYFVSSATTITSSTSDTSLQGVPGANLYLYITSVQLFNSSATGTLFSLKNGSGGTVIWQGYIPATGGAVIPFTVPLGGNQNMTVNTALYGACGTSVASVYVNVQGYKGS